MSAVNPGWAEAAAERSSVASMSAAPNPVMPRIVSIVRLVVLLTVAVMLRARDLFAPFAALDVLLGVGSAYVLVSTFWPRREGRNDVAQLFMACDIFFISALIWFTGGVGSDYYLLYYLPILYAAMRLNFRDAVTTSLLAALAYILIAVADGPLVPVVTTGVLRAATFGGSVVILAMFFGALGQEVRANRLLTERLREALQAMSAVYGVARAANTRDSVHDVLDTMLRHAMRVAGAEAGALALADDDGACQLLVSHRSPGAGPIEFHEPIAQAAIERREWISRAGEAEGGGDPRRVTQELFVPLFVGYSPLAVMQIRSAAAGGIGEREMELLQALCAEGAMAIENVRLRAETRRAAAVDYLTGLYNRREFERRLEAEIRRTARHGGTLALVLLDADDFKLCNDSYGHPAGDQVLQALAGGIEGVIRAEDSAARFGGDEFAIVLPQTDVDGALAVARKVQRAVDSLRFGWAQEGWRATVSIGVASAEDELSASLLTQKADRALYQAKCAGKNRICAWQRGTPTESASTA